MRSMRLNNSGRQKVANLTFKVVAVTLLLLRVGQPERNSPKGIDAQIAGHQDD